MASPGTTNAYPSTSSQNPRRAHVLGDEIGLGFALAVQLSLPLTQLMPFTFQMENAVKPLVYDAILDKNRKDVETPNPVTSSGKQ